MMLSFDDARWFGLLGGYRSPYDPRPALIALDRGKDTKTAWDEIWNNLYHQGDIGEATYAALPHLVDIHAKRGEPEWNTYLFAAVVEDARRNPRNPQIPVWLKQAYDQSIARLVDLALADFKAARSSELINGILAVLAFSKGHFALGKLAYEFTEDERLDLMKQAGLS